MSRSGDHLDFTLEHMVPVLLAEAQNLGGDHLMYATVPFLGGAALLAFYLFARRVLRYPVAALGAMLGLGLLMPQVSFSRDSTTEIPMQVLLFSAAWMLCDRRTLRHRGTAFTAGLFLGLLQAMHIDGLAFVIGVPLAGLCWWFRARREERPEVARSLLWTAFGVAVGVALGFLDLLHRSPHYFRTLHFDVERLAAVALLAVGAAIGIALLSRVVATSSGVAAREGAGRPPRGNPGVGGRLRRLARTPGAADRAARRPSSVVATVQRLTHLTLDPTRRYFEHSLGWTSWYLGPITLTLAIIGAALATRAFVRGTLRVQSQVAAAILAPPALLYLWRPSITPDQIWAMRRFLPAVLPLLVLAAFGTLCLLAGSGSRVGSPYARRVVAVALGVLAVAYPVYTIRDVSQMTQQRGFPAPSRTRAGSWVARRGGRAAGVEAAHVVVRPPDAAFVLRRSGWHLEVRRCRRRQARCERVADAGATVGAGTSKAVHRRRQPGSDHEAVPGRQRANRSCRDEPAPTRANARPATSRLQPGDPRLRDRPRPRVVAGEVAMRPTRRRPESRRG